MYKLDKTISQVRNHAEAEKDKRFLPTDTLSERLSQAWYLTCMAYGIDPEKPPKMEKTLTSIRKHEK